MKYSDQNLDFLPKNLNFLQIFPGHISRKQKLVVQVWKSPSFERFFTV